MVAWMKEWVKEYGSSRLKKGVAAGFEMASLMQVEYFAKEYPGWTPGGLSGHFVESRSENHEPSEYALDFFLAEREKTKGCELYVDGRKYALVVVCGGMMAHKMIPQQETRQ